jgi:hypothetical protein
VEEIKKKTFDEGPEGFYKSHQDRGKSRDPLVLPPFLSVTGQTQRLALFQPPFRL